VDRTWTTILVSAATAALISLLTELLVRPWLELRKDRILRRDRDRAAFITELIAYSTYIEDAVTVARSSTVGVRYETLKELIERTSEFRNKALYVRWGPAPIRDLIEFGLGVTYAKFVGLLAILDDDAMRVQFQGFKEPVARANGGEEQRFRELTPEEIRLLSRYMAEAFFRVIDTQGFFTIPVRYFTTPRWHLAQRLSLRRQAESALAEAKNPFSGQQMAQELA
jgi:hypothetical protein